MATRSRSPTRRSPTRVTNSLGIPLTNGMAGQTPSRRDLPLLRPDPRQRGSMAVARELLLRR
eukprot:13751068-Heterocapsa_arctica.AAC.1